jgi:peptidoglycan/xylan/chitin deacetylase (PgdA/CDA1 family)
MALRSLLGAVNRKMLCAFNRRMISLANLGPIVSFGFDDFPRTAYLVAGRILEDHGARGTYYTAAGLMNTSNGLGDLCNLDDLHSLLENGHELGTQTYDHSSCREVSLHGFQNDVEKGMREVEHLTGHPAANFAYPYGHVTLGAKRTLGHLGSARSIFPGINGPEVDLNLLRANRVYGGLDQAQPIQRLIQQNVEQRGWLIFYTHDVRREPSEYGCTPELFEFAVSAAAKSGSRILTVEQVLREIASGTSRRGAAEVENPAASISGSRS